MFNRYIGLFADEMVLRFNDPTIPYFYNNFGSHYRKVNCRSWLLYSIRNGRCPCRGNVGPRMHLTDFQ